MVPGPGGAPAPSTPSSVLNNTAPAPGVRLRITTSTGEDISGTKLGEKLFLRIEIDRASIYGIFAKNLRAISPADSDEIELLDSRGCPTDPVIFPGLEKVPGSEDLQGSFEAFKFSDTSVAKFQVNVAFCLGGCNPSTAATASCPTAYGDARPRLASLGCGGGTRRRGCSTLPSWGRRCWSAARLSPRRSSWRWAPRWTPCRRGADPCCSAGTAARVRGIII